METEQPDLLSVACCRTAQRELFDCAVHSVSAEVAMPATKTAASQFVLTKI